MALSLQTLNDAVLDEILRHVFNDALHMRLVFLSSMGSQVSHAAMRVLYTDITLEDDMRYHTTWATSPVLLGPLAALLNNPMRYGTFVRRLIVREPTQFNDFEPLETVKRRAGSPLLQFDDAVEDEDDDMESQGVIRPLEWAKVHELLSWCPGLTDLVWRSSTPPPDGLCESLALFNSKLVLFAFVPETPLKPESPQTPVHARYVPPRWDAPSLPLLTQLPVRTLHLSRLSQTGSRALGQLCMALGDQSLLENVLLDFLWLDDALCEKLAAAAKKIKRLRLSTSGTKLTDRGLNAVLDAAMDLEDFDLTEVEGRLSKTMWQTAEIPAPVTKFAIRLSENGPHHSWVADHLGSLQSLSFQHLTVINICRTMHPFDSSFDDVTTLQPITDGLVAALRQARGLESLECDWWSWRQEHLKPILESCAKLQVLRIAFDGPISKLLCLTSIFAPAPLLRQFYVYIPRAVVPLRSPTARGFPLTPSASPTVASSAILPSVSSTTPPDVSEDSGDTHTPPLRDVKKFVRRCQALTLLDWYGWNGRGSWTVSRPRGVTKSTLNVTVEYSPPPAPSEALCARRALEDTAAQAGWVAGATERDGANWTGDLADMYAAQRQAEELATSARTKMSRKMSAASTAKEPEVVVGADPFASTTSASSSPVSTSFANGPLPLPPLKLGRTVTGSNHEPLSPTSPKRERRPRTRRGTDASDGHAGENSVSYNGNSHRGGGGGSSGGGAGGGHWQRGHGDGTHKRNGGRANVTYGSQQQEARTAEDRRPRGTRGRTTRTASD